MCCGGFSHCNNNDGIKDYKNMPSLQSEILMTNKDGPDKYLLELTDVYTVFNVKLN